MEAKEIKWCPAHGYPLPCDKCGMPLSRQDQKEIYQAGIEQGRKEVVEWLQSHQLISPDKDSITQFEPFYQITQKELAELAKEGE